MRRTGRRMEKKSRRNRRKNGSLHLFTKLHAPNRNLMLQETNVYRHSIMFPLNVLK